MTQLLLDMMAARLDGYMVAHGFTRTPRGVAYRRKVGDTKQTLEVTMFVGPRYAREAEAHIYPDLSIVMPQVNRIAVEMTRDGPDPAHPGFTLRQAIDSLAPAGCRPLWLVTSHVSFMDLGQPIVDFIDRWVMGFLDDYSTPEDIVRGYEAGDTRPLGAVSGFYLPVVASYVLLERPRDAYRVLEKHYKGVHTRRKYATTFEYVQRLIAS